MHLICVDQVYGFLYSSPIWGPFEALLRPYWSDFGHILERHDLFGHRVWLECFFLEVTNSSFFPFEQKNWRTLFRVLPEAFPRSIKSTHPTIDWHSKCQNKISRFLDYIWAIECHLSICRVLPELHLSAFKVCSLRISGDSEFVGGRLPHPFWGHGVMLRIALFTSWASARWLECHEVKSHIISHLLNMASLIPFSFSLNFAISTSKRGNSSSDHGPRKHRVATHTILGLVATALDHAPGLLSYACSWTRQTRAVHKRKHLHLRQIGEWPKWMWKDVESSCQWTNNICHTSARTALDCTCRTEWRLGTNLESLELRTARLPVVDWFIPSNNGVAGVTLWARMTAKQRSEMTL